MPRWMPRHSFEGKEAEDQARFTLLFLAVFLYDLIQMARVHLPASAGVAIEGTGGHRRFALTGELFIIPLEHARFLVYAPLQSSAFIGNAAVVRFLQALQSTGGDLDCVPPQFENLIQLLLTLQILNPGTENLPLRTCDGEPQPVGVTLFLTTTCNLRCRYCYAASGDSPAKFMSLETAKKGIDFIFQNAVALKAGSVHVGYHGGGEPALNWAVLSASVAYARERASKEGIKLETSLATNAVLSDEKIDWLVRNMTGASVSFDGLPALHDLNRLTVSGEGTSARVMHTMRRLDAAGFGYGVRATILADQIELLPESVEFICANFQPKVVQVEPVYLLGRGSGAVSAETQTFVEFFRLARAVAKRRGGDLLFSGVKVASLSNHFCAATTDGFCLTPDGNVTSCFEAFSEETPLASRFFYGRPGAGPGSFEFDPAVLSDLRSLGVENRVFCRECFARWTCAGDCLYKVLSANGGGDLAGSGRCHIIRELTKDLILEKVAESGGLVWAGRQGGGSSCWQAQSVPDQSVAVPPG
jgi:uncharacterized protein